MTRADTALLVVDVQQKFMPVIRESEILVWNIRRLIDGAALFKIRVAATEQYPQGLGSTVEPLAGLIAATHEKSTFSCREAADLFDSWASLGVSNIVVTGIELHVCILQTVLDLIAEGFSVFLPVDALSSQRIEDGEQALIRMRTAGAVTTTTESVLFEWCETATDPHFKKISSLACEKPPH
jgi:nicotinamidase-related amidase